MPLLLPVGRRWNIDIRHSPKPKKEASTMPSAVSSLRRVVRVRIETVAEPANPASSAPIKIANGSFSRFHKNPKATPGSTAWERASPSSAMRRTTRKLPKRPQEIPSRRVPRQAYRTAGSDNVTKRQACSVHRVWVRSPILAACAENADASSTAQPSPMPMSRWPDPARRPKGLVEFTREAALMSVCLGPERPRQLHSRSSGGPRRSSGASPE